MRINCGINCPFTFFVCNCKVMPPTFSFRSWNSVAKCSFFVLFGWWTWWTISFKKYIQIDPLHQNYSNMIFLLSYMVFCIKKRNLIKRYHNRLTNMNIYKNIKKNVHLHSIEHVRIVAFFFPFPNISVMSILLNLKFQWSLVNIHHFCCFLRAYISNFKCLFCLYFFSQKLKNLVHFGPNSWFVCLVFLMKHSHQLKATRMSRELISRLTLPKVANCFIYKTLTLFYAWDICRDHSNLRGAELVSLEGNFSEMVLSSCYEG